MSAELLMGICIGGISVLVVILLCIMFANRNYAEKEAASTRRASNLLEIRNGIGDRQVEVLGNIECELFRANKFQVPRRERIATIALQGYLAGRTHDKDMPLGTGHHDYIAKGCLCYADALMDALDGKGDA